MTLWDKVESAMVGSLADAQAKFIREVATGSYTLPDIIEIAVELEKAINDSANYGTGVDIFHP